MRIINEPLVLVLGAGASMPYGFPSGLQLTEYICSVLTAPDEIHADSFYGDLIQCGFSKKEIEDFRKTLQNSFKYSVDAFLEYRNEFIDIGKTAIARTILPLQIKEKLGSNAQRHWYRYLFNNVDFTPNNIRKNRLSIITFNYDTSLEYFLLTALINSYGLSYKHAAALLSTIPVIHVHGLLTGVPDSEDTWTAENWSKHTTKTIKNAANGIKIIHEEINETQEFQIARQCISTAKRICFLGFGFHTKNLQRLGFINGDVKERGIIYATTYGMSENEKKLMRAYFHPPHHGVNYFEADYDCYDALNNWDLIQ